MSASIFNDVIGPIMRGPSSSHVAGAARIGELIRQCFDAPLSKVICDFDPTGSLAESYTGHGTVIGFPAGLMAIDLSDPSVDDYERLLREHNLELSYRIYEYGADHPGNYLVHAQDASGIKHDFEAVALGGGMVELRRIDGFRVAIGGDYDELLVEVDDSVKGPDDASSAHAQPDETAVVEPSAAWLEYIRAQVENFMPGCFEKAACSRGEKIMDSDSTGHTLYNISLSKPVAPELREHIEALQGVTNVYTLTCILPTHSKSGVEVPYENCEELFAFVDGKTDKSAKANDPWPAWRYAAYYESIRGGITEEAVLKTMSDIYEVMEQAVATGLAGTEYENRVLGPQAHKMQSAQQSSKQTAGILPMEPMNTMIRNITAVMEAKSSMNLIVAAPTVGSCGCVPGTLTALGEVCGFGRDELVKALLVAGLVGVFFGNQATFSAEVGGCQVECGAASGMTAAAIASLQGGTIKQCMDAASLALQNITGLACDPVANRVEVPCLGKNIMAGSNALAAANMMLAGYDAVVPLDQTIVAIYDIGTSLPLELRCTYGGLGKTKASNDIRAKLDKF